MVTKASEGCIDIGRSRDCNASGQSWLWPWKVLFPLLWRKREWQVPSSFFPLFSRYIYALCDDISSLRFATNSVLKDFEQDGVVYLELRTTPRVMPLTGISRDDYVSNVLQSISDFNDKSQTMRTKLILSVDRRHDSSTAMEIVNLALKYQTKGVVGIDLVSCVSPSTLLPWITGAPNNQTKLFTKSVAILRWVMSQSSHRPFNMHDIMAFLSPSTLPRFLALSDLSFWSYYPSSLLALDM